MTTYDFSNLDFAELKADLITYIKDSDEFVDYEFEGSALNSLASLLAYITLQQNYYLNMTTQELYLGTASIYKNAVAIAKSLNYIPHRMQSATINTTFAVDQTGDALQLDSGAPILIPANCDFLVDGVRFTTGTSYNIYDTDPIDIELRQRTIFTETYNYEGLAKELLYGSEIDNDYFVVTVNGDLWSEYLNDIDVDSYSEIFYLDQNLNDKLELSFGDNIIGLNPTIGAEIVVTYGVTTGAEGNNLSEITLDQIIYSGPYAYDNDDCTIVSSLSSAGTSKESIQSIKANAPKFYEAQNRAVTKLDYHTILQQVAFIETLNVWDGAEMVPPVYGSVYGTFKPLTGPDLLTDTQKLEIQNFITPYMPLTLKFRIEDPLYIYLDITSYVYYYKEYLVDTTTIRAEIENLINNYFSTELILTDTILKYSNLLEVIDTPTEVSNNLTNIDCFIKFNKASGSSNAYIFDIGNGIKIGSIDNDYIQDDSLGNIILKSDSSVIGSINYDTGNFNFIFDGMDVVDNIINFNTSISDIYFFKKNLPVLNSTTFTFEGI